MIQFEACCKLVYRVMPGHCEARDSSPTGDGVPDPCLLGSLAERYTTRDGVERGAFHLPTRLRDGPMARSGTDETSSR